MKLILALAAFMLPAPVLGAATTTGVDPMTILVSYGVAAPFAALCLMQMRSREAALTKKEDELAAERDENKKLREAAIVQARDSTLQIATLLADAGRLYRQGNEVLAQHPSADHDELQSLSASVQELVRRLNEEGR